MVRPTDNRIESDTREVGGVEERRCVTCRQWNLVTHYQKSGDRWWLRECRSCCVAKGVDRLKARKADDPTLAKKLWERQQELQPGAYENSKLRARARSRALSRLRRSHPAEYESAYREELDRVIAEEEAGA